MPMYRVSYFFQQGAFGWSESIHNLQTSLSAVTAEAGALRDARIAMLPPSCTLSYIRISDDLVFRDSVLINENPSSPGTRAIEDSEPPFTAALCRIFASPTVRRSIYLRPVSSQEGINGDRKIDSTGWLSAFNPWRSLLVSESTGWAIKYKAVAPVGFLVNGFTVSDKRLTVQAPGATFAIGQRIQLRGFKSVSKVDGQYRVTAIPSAANFTLDPLLAVDDPEVTQYGAAFDFAPQLAKITGVNPIRVTSRKTGRPFDSPRGRSGIVRA